MKKIILIVVCIVIIWGGYFYFLNKDRDIVLQQEKADFVPVNEIKDTKEVRVGDMVVDVPEDVVVQKDDENHYSILIEGQYKESPQTNENVKNHALRITYGKDWNEENLSLQEWFDLNGPQTQKTSPTSLYDEFKKIKNITYLESLYEAPTSMYASDYYDVIIKYFTNKTDLYQIISFAKPKTESLELTLEEQSSIQNYEKIVDEIIQSIRFVE